MKYSRENSSTLYSAGEDALVRAWDTVSSRTKRIIRPTAAPIEALAICPEGERLAVGASDAVEIWDAETGRRMCSVTDHPAMVHCASFSATNDGGQTLAFGCADGIVQVWKRSENVVTDSPVTGGAHSVCSSFTGVVDEADGTHTWRLERKLQAADSDIISLAMAVWPSSCHKLKLEDMPPHQKRRSKVHAQSLDVCCLLPVLLMPYSPFF